MPAVIDVHTHVVPAGWPDLTPILGPDAPWLRVDSPTEATIMLGDRVFRPITDACWNADTRLDQMAADGVDMQVLLPTPVFFGYREDSAAATQVSALFNDLTLQIAAQAPDRFIPFCQVPLQDTDAACRELDRCLANGHRGVEIGNHITDRDLDDAGILTFLQHCADRDVPVFVHPWDIASDPRMNRWMGQWLVGMPAETHLTIAALVLSGAFDRLPASLRLCFAHGGGSFPFWVGRMDNAWYGRPDLVATSSAQPPSAYLNRFSVDSAVFIPAALSYLVEVMGPDHVLLGSDYPYPLGERPAGAAIRDANLAPEIARSVLGGNALQFLGLSPR